VREFRVRTGKQSGCQLPDRERFVIIDTVVSATAVCCR
jgi:hypothetical protein